jgi:hypothetical protein
VTRSRDNASCLQVTAFFIVSKRDYLLNERWRAEKADNSDCTFGHCYIAAEALWHLTGKVHNSYVATTFVDGQKETHWYLMTEKGDILDPTARQYQPDNPPYGVGRKCGFLTNFPSKRAQEIIDWVIGVL